MKVGLLISLLLHGGAVFGGLLWVSSAPPVAEEVKFIPLNLVTVSDVTNVKPQSKRRKPEVKDEPAVLQNDTPDTGPQEISSNPAPSDEATDAPPVFDLEAFSKMAKDAREKDPSANEQVVLGNEIGDQTVQASGEGLDMTVSQEDYIKTKMQPCWKIDTGAKDYHKLRVEVLMSLHQDAEVANIRVVNDLQIFGSSNASWRAARNNVVSALNACAPYEGLLGRNYQSWREMKLNFQPPAPGSGGAP